jgi:hypothetical protein
MRVAFLPAVLACTLPPREAMQAATYYVAFDSGQDSNSGLSPITPWKRAPGDPTAEAIARQTPLQPGDVVLFKGGTIYRGSVVARASGTRDSPITFKGNGWGDAPARVEGADPWQPDWTACPSPEFCLGNLNYANIYFAPAPPGYANFHTSLYEDGDFLWYSQGPDPPDPFYYDIVSQYYRVPRGSEVRQARTFHIDVTRLNQLDPEYWKGAYVAAWIQGNTVATRRITSFDPATHTLHHEDLGGNPYTDRDGFYSILNHVSLISRPGEYAYDASLNRIYLWPRNSDNPKHHSYSVQVRDTAFSIPSASNIVVEGFAIQHFAQAVQANRTNSTGILVRQNDISKLRSADRYAIHVNASDSTVEENRVVD